MAKNSGATRRDSGVAKRLGSAARTGGGGAGVIAKVKNFLGLNPIKSNFINAGGRLNAARSRKAGGGGARK